MRNLSLMKYGYSFVIVFFCLSPGIFSQYFQQKVDFKIKVRLNDTTDMLYADMEMRYSNQAPEALTELYLHLWPNAYSSPHTALGQQIYDHNGIRIKKESGYLRLLDSKINAKEVSVSYIDAYKEMARIPLAEPLQPGESLLFTCSYVLKLPPANLSRLGVEKNADSKAYMITQWYPKPAVYDKNGWHIMPYLSQGEFYSEFGKFDVEVTLPASYVVAATGLLQSEKEKEFLSARIQNPQGIFPYTTAREMKSIRFVQDSIHDFAWFANPNYQISTDTATLPNGKKVLCYAYFTPKNADLWKNAAAMLKKSVLYYSDRIGNYPYSACSAVDGTISAGGGMEYPMITVVGEQEVDRTILHEVGHNWFYGILASNERQFPWMDEGVNSYFENAFYADAKADTAHKKMGIFSLLQNQEALAPYIHHWMARHQKHQALDLSSEKYSMLNYGVEIYMHSAAMFRFLEMYLGREVFDSAMQAYYKKWAFKHPQPADLQREMERSSAQNLDWFFKGLLSENQKPDFSIHKKGTELEVQNHFPHPLPARLSFYKSGVKTDDIWIEPFMESHRMRIPDAIDKIVVNEGGELWEKSMMNNELEPHKPCATCDPLRISPLFAFPSLKKNFIAVQPVYLWNNYNKSMLGLAIHNQGILPKRHSFYLLPLYSFNPSSFAAFADYRYRIWPDKSGIAYMDFGVNFRRFAWDYRHKALPYNRLEFRVVSEFKRKDKSKARRSGMEIFYSLIHKDLEGVYQINPLPSISYGLLRGQYFYENFNRSYPLMVKAGLEIKQEFLPQQQVLPVSGKIWAEVTQDFYYFKKKRIQIRHFASLFLENKSGIIDNRIRLNGWSGRDDYGLEGLYFGRSAQAGSFLGNQFLEREGNFKLHVPGAQSNLFLFSTNFKIDLPIPYFPVGVYSDLGFIGYRVLNMMTGSYFTQTRFYTNTGLYLDILPGVFSVYFPIPQSSTPQMQYAANNFKDPYFSYVRFSLNLLKLNPYQFKEWVRMLK